MYGYRIRRGTRQGQITRHGTEIIEAQRDADGTPNIAFAQQIAFQLRAQVHKYFRQCRTIMPHMQVAIEGRFTADGFGFGMRKHRPLVHAMRSEEHTSELQSLMRISYAVFCLKKKIRRVNNQNNKKQDKLINSNSKTVPVKLKQRIYS